MSEKQLVPESGHTLYTVLDEQTQHALDYFANKSNLGNSYKNRLSAVAMGRWMNYLVYNNIGLVHKARNEAGEYVTLLPSFNNQEWVPGSEAVAGMAKLEGAVATRLDRAAKTKQGVPKRAVEETHSRVIDGPWKEAIANLQELNLGMISPEDEASRPNAGLIRATPEVLKTMAKHMMKRDFAWSNHWPRSNEEDYTKAEQYWLGFMVAAARHAGDRAIVDLYNYIYKQEEAGKDFLSEQIAKAEQLPVIQRQRADRRSRLGSLGLRRRDIG